MTARRIITRLSTGRRPSVQRSRGILKPSGHALNRGLSLWMLSHGPMRTSRFLDLMGNHRGVDGSLEQEDWASNDRRGGRGNVIFPSGGTANEYIAFDTAAFDFCTRAWSLGLWFKTTETGFNDTWAGGSSLASSNPLAVFQNQSPSTTAGWKLILRQGDGAANNQIGAANSGAHRDGKWHYIFATYDPSLPLLRGWLDLQEGTVGTANNSLAATTFNAFTVCALRRTGSPEFETAAAIDDLRLWKDRVLTFQEQTAVHFDSLSGYKLTLDRGFFVPPYQSQLRRSER